MLEVRRHHLQAFDRRQHRDGRRDHAVAVEERSAEDADDQQQLAQPRLVGHGLGGQREHRDQAALAFVVGAQHEHDVLDGDDDREGPEEHRQDAVDVLHGERHMAVTEDFLDRIENAGADVAIDDADGADDEAGRDVFGG
ncbi:hypothetical protein D9M69_645850 [compost metagenome]